MLAQIQSVDAEYLKSFLLVILGLLGGAGTVIGLLKTKRKIEPQPLEITTAREFVTTAACHETRQKLSEQIADQAVQIEKLWCALRDDKSEMEIAARSRSAGIYTKIDQVRAELTHANTELQKQMTTGFQSLERALGRLEGKIQD